MNLKKVFFLVLFINLILSSVCADSDGVWHFVEDFRGGVFGFDEQDFVTNFTFKNEVYFEEDVHFRNFSSLNVSISNLYVSEKIGIGVVNPQALVDVAGKIYMREETKDSDLNITVVTKGYIDNIYYNIIKSVSSWYSGDWTTCSVSCGGGVQTRIVDCRTSSGVVVDEKYCAGVKPEISQVCNTQVCEVNRCWESPSDVRYTSYIDWLHLNYGTTSWENCHGQCIWRCGRKGSKSYCTSNYPDKHCGCVSRYQLNKTGTKGTATLYECVPIS